jgi:hypothetical protein
MVVLNIAEYILLITLYYHELVDYYTNINIISRLVTYNIKHTLNVDQQFFTDVNHK